MVSYKTEFAGTAQTIYRTVTNAILIPITVVIVQWFVLNAEMAMCLITQAIPA